MKTNKLIIIFIVLGVIAVGLLLFLQFKPQKIHLQGEVVMRQISISPRIAGRIEEVFVKEGDYINAGAKIALLDSPDIVAKSAQAAAASKAAQAQKAKANKGAREEDITAAYNIWQKAIVGEELAEKTYKRVQQLYKGGVVSEQKLDEAMASYRAATKDKEAAYSRYDMARNGTREEDKDSAHALSEQAKGVVSEVESYVREITVTAPISGEISSVIVERGELVAPGLAVATLVDLNDVWLSFNIREDLLTNIKMNDIIDINIPALGKQKYKFRVNYISRLGDFAVWSATKTRGEYDLKTFEVRLVPENSIDGLRQGMTAVFYVKK
ncbi:HlyD family secretion protein [Parelusimicrobium proximum]|uniref:HlyD family secretion protein n=1 Tax=Parelusimicrobium proximum TaxID=3228953 RepID=UPI003D163E60